MATWIAKGSTVSNGDTTLTVTTNTDPQLTPQEELCRDCQRFCNGFTVQHSHVHRYNEERPSLVSVTTRSIVWYDPPHTLASLRALVEEAEVAGLITRLSSSVFAPVRFTDARNVREANEARAREIAEMLNAGTL